jgi:hypothetical protein
VEARQSATTITTMPPVFPLGRLWDDSRLHNRRPADPRRGREVAADRAADGHHDGAAGKMRAANSKSAVAAAWEAHPSSFSIESPPRFSVRYSLAAVERGEDMGSPAGAHRVAPLHSATGRRESASTGRCCDHFQVAIHMHPFRPDSVHGIQVAVCVQAQCGDGVHLLSRSQN